MEVIEGATPKGLEEAGVGETPLLEMVLPGVTAIPGAGDEPGSQREGQGGGGNWLSNTERFFQIVLISVLPLQNFLGL